VTSNDGFERGQAIHTTGAMMTKPRRMTLQHGWFSRRIQLSSIGAPVIAASPGHRAAQAVERQHHAETSIAVQGQHISALGNRVEELEPDPEA